MVRKLIVCVIGVVFMAGCSGGDGSSTARGGDSGSTITQTGQYNGLTTPALFTVTNAKALSSDAYTTNRVVATATGVGKITTISGATPCLLQGITSTLKERVTSTLLRSSSSNKIVALTIKDTITGMSGSITYQTELDQTTGNFTGKITFTEYQDTASSATITGTTDFTGNLNTATSIFTSLNMQMNSLLGTLSDWKPGGTWSSSTPSIATVNTVGVITPVSAGSTIITYYLSAGCRTLHTVTGGFEEGFGRFTVVPGQSGAERCYSNSKSKRSHRWLVFGTSTYLISTPRHLNPRRLDSSLI